MFQSHHEPHNFPSALTVPGTRRTCQSSSLHLRISCSSSTPPCRVPGGVGRGLPSKFAGCRYDWCPSIRVLCLWTAKEKWPSPPNFVLDLETIRLPRGQHLRKSGKAGIRRKIFRIDHPIDREAFSLIAQAFFVWNNDLATYFSETLFS